MTVKNWKKIAFMLALCLLLSSAAVFAAAEGYGDFTYSIPYGTYAVITGYQGQGGQIDIPETIDGVPVTSISSSAFADAKADITDVTIPASVSKFSSAFAGCKALASVTLMDGVTAISPDAFNGCSALTDISIPATVTAIGSGAFKGCASLVEVVVPEGVTSIGADAFSGCTSLVSLTLPASLERAVGNSLAELNTLQGVYFTGSADQWSQLVGQLALPAAAAVHFGSASETNAAAPAEEEAAPAAEETAAPVAEAPAASHTHDWVNGPDTATCTAGGQIFSTCSICGASEIVYTAPKGHSATPAFKENNTIVLTCSRCGKEYTGERINGIQWPASSRDAATVCANRGYHICKLIERTATCTKGGLSESITCSTCGSVLQSSYEIGPRGHWFRDWEIVEAGTCVVEGKKQRSCRNCSYVEVKSAGLNPAIHYTCAVVGAREATCAVTGYTGDVVCLRCGKIVNHGCVIPKSVTHTGRTELRGVIAPTATRDGYTGDLYCLTCNQKIKIGKVDPMTGSDAK